MMPRDTRRATAKPHDPDKPFPYGRASRWSVISCLVGSCIAMALSFAPMAAGRSQPVPGLLFGAIVLIGLSMTIMATGAIGPNLRHHARTGVYLIPGKGGVIWTRHGIILWPVLTIFGGIGAWISWLGLKGLMGA